MNLPKPAIAVTLTGFLAVLALNVALIVQNKRLKMEIAAPSAMLPQVGTKIERLEGFALDGSKNHVSFSGTGNKTVLFVFSTRCGVCNLNWPEWQLLARSLRSRPFRLVYANIQSPLDRQYAAQYGIDKAVVFAQLDPRDEPALNLRLTPLTILLDANGDVVHVWPGLLEGQQLSNLRQALGLKTAS